MGLVRLSLQTVLASISSINHMIFIMEKLCVFSAVRTESGVDNLTSWLIGYHLLFRDLGLMG
jgi:hypothetical protein